MTCLAVTLLILIAYYTLFSSASSANISNRLLLSFVMSCTQIVLTELALGIGHQLHLSNLIITNLLLAGIVLIAACHRGTAPLISVLRNDITNCKLTMSTAWDPYTAILGILTVLTYGWITLSAYYLPPRGIDDLVYHLPPIFEYIQTHKISLLPVTLRYQYAFPENAELLFLWPTIFAKSQRMVDGTNIPIVFVSILAMYAFLRHFEIKSREALFAALLYALCPVVMMQAGVNYIDIIVSLFCLLGLYFAIQFYNSRSITFLYAAGISTGLMLGMKYTALLLVLPIQILILPRLIRVERRHKAGYVMVIILLCGWWYGRNMVLFNDPFYPLNFLGPILGKPGGVGILSNIRVNLTHWVSTQLIEDIGIGSYDGGFGLVFWGVGFSSWLYCVVYSLARFHKTGMVRLVVLSYLPAGFLLLLSVSEAEVPFMGRLAIIVVSIALFSLCETMKNLNDTRCVAVIKITCILLSLLNISLLSVSIKPHYSLTAVVRDRLRQQYPSGFKYVAEAERTTRADHGLVWEVLDLLTRDEKTGLNCHIISDQLLFSPAPVYGSNLQNRVAYMHPSSPGKIDAYVATYYPGLRNIKLDATTSSYDIVADRRYIVAANWPYGCLILKRSVYEKPDKQRLMADYYRRTWPEAITQAMQFAPQLAKGIPLVTSSQIGYGVRFLDMKAQRAERVVITPTYLEEMVADRLQLSRCYTIGKPLAGYHTEEIGHVAYRYDVLTLYLNKKD